MLKDSVTPISMALFYGSSIMLVFHHKKASPLLTYMAYMGKSATSLALY